MASVDVPQAVVDAVSRIVLQPIPIQNLPYDIEVTGLTVQPDGVCCCPAPVRTSPSAGS